MLVAPSEPKPLAALGTVRPTPERYGADFLFAARPVGLVGIQRKAFPGDFLASLNDGRLEKELSQMRALDVAVLLLEGRGRWTTDGDLIFEHSTRPWSRSSHRKYLLSVQAQGVWVMQTDSLDDTAAALADIEAWARKPVHDATRTRPGPRRDGWGRVDDRDWNVHIAKDLPEVGPRLAERVVDHFWPRPVIRLNVTEQELRQVHGIGAVKARRICKPFEGAA